MDRLNIGGNGGGPPPRQPKNLQDPLEPGEVLVRLRPKDNGMSVGVTPHMPPGELAELMHQATGALVLSEYALFSAFASTVQGKPTVLRTVANDKIPVELAVKLLRLMADGLEAGNLPQVPG